MSDTTHESTPNRYLQRGVSSKKEEVHAVVDQLDRGLFPGAFCKITEDFLTGNPHKCNIIHADGSGTKALLAYLHYKETGDPSVFRGIAQDSIVMNLDDLICVGATDGILISNTINRNAKNIPGEVLRALIQGSEAFLEKLNSLGVSIKSGGGETADVGDLTSALTVDSCAVVVMDRAHVVDNSKIIPGLAIVGLSSTGRATYESEENSGIGSNGLTSARHELLSDYYSGKYKETFDSAIDPKLVYCGPSKLQDSLPNSNFSVGSALLSPTRTYAPVVKQLLAEFRSGIKGIVHCSGGGQTKCLRFGHNIHYIKDNLFEAPPLFRFIKEVSNTTEREMYQVYNMGHRMEIYCEPKVVNEIVNVSQFFNIEAQQVGYTEAAENKNKLTIKTHSETIEYSL